MAIINVTPDSFYDGGRYEDVDAALRRAEQVLDEGADLLDIGGQSTRPGAPEAGLEQERRRVLPVVEALVRRGLPLPISVDTWRGPVAEAALDRGAVIVNDVSGGRRDPLLLDAAGRAGAAVVLMHMRGTPRTMQADVRYDDLLSEVVSALRSSCAAATAAGVPAERQAVDPGVGFGKSAQGCVELLAGLGALASLERPVLVGASRKSFLGTLFGHEPQDRLAGSLAAAVAAVDAGASIVRVHDVAATRRAVDVAAAIRDARR